MKHTASDFNLDSLRKNKSLQKLLDKKIYIVLNVQNTVSQRKKLIKTVHTRNKIRNVTRLHNSHHQTELILS